MPQLRHLLTEESALRLQAVKFMSADIEAVDSMTRTDLYTHFAVRQRILSEQSNDWKAVYDAEVEAKIRRWKMARNLHERALRARRQERETANA